MKVALCRVEEIPEEGAKTADFFGREVLIFRRGGKPKAFVNICTHLSGPMEKKGEKLVCKWHGAEFDCDHGKRIKGPAPENSMLIELPTIVENGMLFYSYG